MYPVTVRNNYNDTTEAVVVTAAAHESGSVYQKKTCPLKILMKEPEHDLNHKILLSWCAVFVPNPQLNVC